MRWYIIQAFSGYEKQVQRSLVERIKRSEFAEQFGDVLVPTEEVIEMRDGKKRTVEHKLFPGYVLINMDMTEDTWHIVKDCPNITGFIGGTPENPAPITKVEADRILNRIQKGNEAPRPKTMFEPGEEVLVIDGPFTDFKGVVKKVDYDKSKLYLTVSVFNRPTDVELEFTKVEKLN
ncbi:transcription termination/antitermination protein NusG [Moraxella nasovis]|uniref:transcription termination/antitermination protein NusG n=1 Tax=Moraxella nasovis TaxID=2904121 RepID=UPI001F61EE44|nr:transcription termination/antitermination protein NusG [Moraxella nasovis]UNU72733.1 transcription termination/antitermination protein NusG [Moraxella nasovis]